MNGPHVMPQASIEEPISKKPRKRTRKAAAGNSANAGAKKKNSSPPAPNAPAFPISSHVFPYFLSFYLI